jgi:ribose/xylose/arabinose/galactoside ABC-type transport system permease subunit
MSVAASPEGYIERPRHGHGLIRYPPRMEKRLRTYGSLLRIQELGLVIVIVLMLIGITMKAGTHQDAGHAANNFLNTRSLIQATTDASLYAIIAVGATVVIIAGGIDLSVGSIYALAGVLTAMALRNQQNVPVWQPLGMCLAIGAACGAINGWMVSTLKVHPFIITLGTMLIFRGISFVVSKAESMSFSDAAVNAVKSTLGLQEGVFPVPAIITVLVTVAGWLYLSKSTAGRNVYAVGGNEQAARYSGIRINRVQIGVFTVSGLAAGIAAFVGCSYYGSASCADATGYELKVIAAAVVGGASLNGGKGAALGALLGAIVITLISQAISYTHIDRNYESIIIGSAVIIAVLLDQWSRKLAQGKLTG